MFQTSYKAGQWVRNANAVGSSVFVLGSWNQNQILGSTLRGFGECLEYMMSPDVVEVVIGVIALGWMVDEDRKGRG